MLKCSFKWHSIWIADFRQLRIRARQARVSPLNFSIVINLAGLLTQTASATLQARSISRIIRLFTVLRKQAAYFRAQRRTKDTIGTRSNNPAQTFMYDATSRGAEEIRFSHALLVIVRRLNRAFFLRACS